MGKQLLNVIMDFMNEKKVEDVKIVDVSNLTPFASTYILCTAPSTRALGAMSDNLETHLLDNGFEIGKGDGTPESGWMIVNAGDVVIHFFTKGKREDMALDDLLEKANQKVRSTEA